MPFSHLYGKLTDLRNRLYDSGLLRTFPLGSKTISIGNITTGGTGKTPLVASVAKVLAERGDKVCILTRGYGRRNPQDRVVVSDRINIITDPAIAVDEPVERAIALGQKAIIIADPDRVAAAEWARRKYGITAFILDDGFQHRRARRDVDFVCIDATDPWGGGKNLPAGRLREPRKNLSRADVVVITRANQAPNIEELRAEISKLNSHAPVFTASTRVVNVVELANYLAERMDPISVERSGDVSLAEALGINEKDGADIKFPIAAFCAIGNPENFINQLKTDGGVNVELVSTQQFRDHHNYTPADAAAIVRQAKQAGAAALVTTAKDAVKLRGLDLTIPCFVVEMEPVLNRPDEFAELI